MHELSEARKVLTESSLELKIEAENREKAIALLQKLQAAQVIQYKQSDSNWLTNLRHHL